MHALAQNYEPHAASTHVISCKKNAQLVSRSSHSCHSGASSYRVAVVCIHACKRTCERGADMRAAWLERLSSDMSLSKS